MTINAFIMNIWIHSSCFQFQPNSNNSKFTLSTNSELLKQAPFTEKERSEKKIKIIVSLASGPRIGQNLKETHPEIMFKLYTLAKFSD